MALAVDATSTKSGTPEAGTTATWAHTCTGSNLGLIVSVGLHNAKTVSGVTYNSVAMTQAVVGTHSANNIRCYHFYLGNPSTGANNVVVTFSAASAEHVSGAISFTGANTGSLIGATGQTDDGAASTTYPTSITTTFNNSYIVDLAATTSFGGSVPTSAQTDIFSAQSAGAGGWSGSSYKSFPTAGATTMSWSDDTNTVYASSAVEVRVLTAAANTNFLQMFK